MRTVPISIVELGAGGEVLVKPPAGSDDGYFRHIYRAATGVRWRAADECFHPVAVFSDSAATWFVRIVATVRDELGVNLAITPQTRWVAVPDTVRKEIESKVKSEPV